MSHRAGATRFWIDTAALELSLSGEPVEVVELDGRCRVIVNGENSKVIYYDQLGIEQTCAFPTSSLIEALEDARGA